MAVEAMHDLPVLVRDFDNWSCQETRMAFGVKFWKLTSSLYEEMPTSTEEVCLAPQPPKSGSHVLSSLFMYFNFGEMILLYVRAYSLLFFTDVTLTRPRKRHKASIHTDITRTESLKMTWVL